MEHGLTDEELAGYVAGWRRRDAEAAAQAVVWRADVRARVVTAAGLLVSQFGAKRVVLFGSLARGDASPGSDVDLLVEGLSTDVFWDAAAAVDRVLIDVPVDLVPAHLARPEVLERAREEGEVIVG